MTVDGFRDIAVNISEEQYICVVLLAAQIMWAEEACDREEAIDLAFSSMIDHFLSSHYVDLKIFLNRVSKLDFDSREIDFSFIDVARNYIDEVHSVTG